jgi:hypothetical protein
MEMVIASFKELSQHLPRGTAVNHRNLTHGNLFLSLDLNLVPPKYKEGALIVRHDIQSSEDVKVKQGY